MSSEFRALGSHIASASVFASNFTLLSESGYFDEAAHTKPLLHLWSLAIEEQFYVVWPLMLWFAVRTRVTALRLACVGAILSFAAGLLLVEVDSAAAFYQPAARAWELLAGAILAIAQRDHAPALERLQTRWRLLPWAGLVAVVASTVLFDERTPFPGWAASIPVLGTLAILAAAPSSRFRVGLGSTRWLVGVGLISYPLYLWHWPLLSFARIVAGRTPSVEARMILVACSIALAWLTYRGIETWFRAPRFDVSKMLALVAGDGNDRPLWIRARHARRLPTAVVRRCIRREVSRIAQRRMAARCRRRVCRLFRQERAVLAILRSFARRRSEVRDLRRQPRRPPVPWARRGRRRQFMAAHRQ
jgi:peptidoglycan/LPS O-acetylase OafA/YrhL